MKLDDVLEESEEVIEENIRERFQELSDRFRNFFKKFNVRRFHFMVLESGSTQLFFVDHPLGYIEEYRFENGRFQNKEEHVYQDFESYVQQLKEDGFEEVDGRLIRNRGKLLRNILMTLSIGSAGFGLYFGLWGLAFYFGLVEVPAGISGASIGVELSQVSTTSFAGGLASWVTLKFAEKQQDSEED